PCSSRPPAWLSPPSTPPVAFIVPRSCALVSSDPATPPISSDPAIPPIEGQVGPHRGALDGGPDVGRCERHVRMPHSVRPERVHDRVDHRGGRAHRGRFSYSLCPDRMVGTRGDRFRELP